MKKFLSIIILGLFIVVLGCEKDEVFQSEVSDTDTTQIVGAEQQGQDVVGDLGPINRIQHPVNNLRSVNNGGCDFTLNPPYFEASLLPGQSITEVKEACVEIPPVGDILFSFDLTGSMGAELDKVKEGCEDIATAIMGEISDCQAGVVSHMDYLLEDYTTCGYTGSYGYGSDYPYQLDQALTDNNTLVKNAVNALSLGSGWDYPESYARVFYETYNDAAIGWRPDAAKYVIAFLDAVPHDCNVAGTSYGEDPVVAAAGLDFYDVLDGMNAAGINLIVVYSGTMTPHWDWWKGLEASYPVTAYRINSDGTIPEGTNIAEFIIQAIKGSVPDVAELYLIPEPVEYASWVSVNPPKHYGVAPGTTVEFEVTYTVPMDMPGGEYNFEMQLWGDDFYYASQEVKIEWIDVELDIKPTSCPNPFNMKANGVLPVAILGTADFDVSEIDVSTIELAGVAPIRSNLEDVAAPVIDPSDECECTTAGSDGYMDLTLKFYRQEIAAALGDVNDGDLVPLTINGQTINGIEIVGTDCIWIKKKGKK